MEGEPGTLDLTRERIHARIYLNEVENRRVFQIAGETGVTTRNPATPGFLVVTGFIARNPTWTLFRHPVPLLNIFQSVTCAGSGPLLDRRVFAGFCKYVHHGSR